MPRKARIDAPGALHHVIVRGIEVKVIFKDRFDRSNFVKRPGTILSESDTPCYARVLMHNTELKKVTNARQVSLARSVHCYLAVRKLLFSCAEVARALNISPSAVSI
jgi:hypothetical protein